MTDPNDDAPDTVEETNVPAADLGYPDPETFPSYDEVDSDEGQAELPADSFDEADADFSTEGDDH